MPSIHITPHASVIDSLTTTTPFQPSFIMIHKMRMKLFYRHFVETPFQSFSPNGLSPSTTLVLLFETQTQSPSLVNIKMRF